MTSDNSTAPSNAFLSKTFGLTNQSALVTGASGGIGRGIAQALAHAGAAVTLIDLDVAGAQSICDEINAAGGTASAVGLDLTQTDAVRDWFDQTEGFSILVNCAGVNRMRDVFDVTPDDYDLIMGLNAKALFFMTQCFAKSCIARNQPGSIIHISSQMGQVGGPSRSAYCASKHAVEGFTKAMAVELGPYRIRVNSICPTFIETDLAEQFLNDPAFRQDVEARIRLGRLGHVEDVANAAIYLASSASAMVTGAALKVDGGWTAA